MVLGLALVASTPRARADDARPVSCDPARAARLDQVLRAEARSASRWRWTWAAVFGVAVAGQVALVAADVVPAGARHDARMMSLYLGAAKASIGVGVRLVLPPRVDRPRLTGDACADDRAAKAAIARTAVRERRSMALNVFGGLALNVSGSLYLGLVEDSWADAGLAFGMGTVVATISALTQPRRVWRQGGGHADGALVADWQLAPWITPRGHGLALIARF